MKKLLCSACLLGEACRYDGKSKPIKNIDKLTKKYKLYPICPEIEGGLETPRLPCEICDHRVIRKDGKDMTAEYFLGAEKTLRYAKDNKISLALLKEKSPSCGIHFRYDGTFQGVLIQKPGITASLLIENNISVFSEDDIDDLI